MRRVWVWMTMCAVALACPAGALSMPHLYVAGSTHAPLRLGDARPAHAQPWLLGAGRAQAIRRQVPADGTLRSISLFVAAHSRARTLVVGLYANRGPRPGALLRSAVLRHPRAERWNRVTLRAVSVGGGRRYWLAVLALGGQARLGRGASACSTVAGARGHLRRLPRAWGHLATPRACALAIVGNGSRSSSQGGGGPGGGPPAEHPPVNVALPAVLGVPQQGHPVIAGHGTWRNSPTAYAFRWAACTGSGCATLAGASGPAFTPTSAEVGKRLEVTVTATNAAGSASATSPQSAAVTASAPPPPPPAPGLHVSANHLLNAAGAVVALRGVDRSGTEYMCTEGYGIFDGPNGSAEFSPMLSWKINAVFMGLNEDCWLGINGAGIANWTADSGTHYINAIKADVKSAESYGLYPVIGFFWGDPGTEVPSVSDPNGGGQPAMPDNDHTPLFWEEVANTFKGDPNVIFRLQEEPHPAGNTTGSSAWTCWANGDVQYSTTSDHTPPTPPTPTGHSTHCSEKATNGSTPYQTVGMQSLINIIRGTGATNVIQVPGVSYANMLSCSPSQNPASCGFLDAAQGTRPTDPANPSHPQLMADIDVYPDTSQYCNTTSCYNATYGPVAAQMPLEAGEIGPNGSVDTQANVLLNWMDARGVGYYAWNWDTWGQLISSYSGTPKSPWGTDYRTRLAG